MKLKLDLPLLLPEVPDTRDRCARTLISLLSAREGLPNRISSRLTVLAQRNSVFTTIAIVFRWQEYASWRLQRARRPPAASLSRSTSRVIRPNLWVSLGVVALLIPATIAGLNIGTAVIFREGSTLLVVANALHLLAFVEDDASGASRGAASAAAGATF